MIRFLNRYLVVEIFIVEFGEWVCFKIKILDPEFYLNFISQPWVLMHKF
jgi:hypothetical protein